MRIRSKSIAETAAAARRFIQEVKGRRKGETALVAGLQGDLGSGKTAFTKEVASALGIADTVTSPTFVLERIYKIPPKSPLAGTFKHLIHIDAYRLEGGSELAHLGWNDIAKDPENLIFVEWPERVEDVLPEDMRTIRFTFIDETTREIQW